MGILVSAWDRVRGAHSTFKDLAQRPKPLYFILRTSPALLKYLIIFDHEKSKSSTNNSYLFDATIKNHLEVLAKLNLRP